MVIKAKLKVLKVLDTENTIKMKLNKITFG